MSRHARIEQLIDADHNEIVQNALFAAERARHQFADEGFQLRQRAQHAEAELLQQRAIFIAYFFLRGREHRAERFALINYTLNKLSGKASQIG